MDENLELILRGIGKRNDCGLERALLVKEYSLTLVRQH
jgi:hypothetical protein